MLRSRTLFEPGTAFSYSNIGYVLAGHLIEVITGMSWWSAMESILLRPLGIEPSFVVAPSRVASGPYVSGHSVTTARSRAVRVDQMISYAEGPTGALALSAADLARLARLHLPGGGSAPLDAAHLAEMRTASPSAEPFGAADGWGLGLALFRTGGADWWGHEGTADGTSCHLRFDPAGRHVVALTTNANTGLALWEDLVAELRMAGLDVGSHAGIPDGSPIEPPQECLGRYVNGETEYTFVTDQDGGCYLANNGKPFARLTFYPGLVFAMADLRTEQVMFTGRFLGEAGTGRIDRIVVGGRLARRQGDGL
ncbi:serine hydrolase domain-containing protein [Nonomuraea antimicrobica]